MIVSLSIFGVGWFSHGRSQDRHSLMVGVAFLIIGSLDVMHTLSYEGMPDFVTANSANKATQFWLIVRAFAAFMFLWSAVFFRKKISRRISRWSLLAMAIAFIAFVFFTVVFYPDVLPSTFAPETGLTAFKLRTEYLIILLLLIAAFLYGRIAIGAPDGHGAVYASAMILCVFSELAFTMYHSVFDSYNILGHLLKIIAFVLIYKGLFIASVNRPYDDLVGLNSELRHKVFAHEVATRQIEALSAELLRISEIERSQIAGELHDSLGQSLVLATLKMQSAMANMPGISSEEKKAIIEPIQQALQTAREISHRLTPAHLENLGIRLALEDLLQNIAKASNLRIKYELAALDVFPGGWNIDFYRIVQEALTNVIKHASASQITVSAGKTAHGLEVTISDNGEGLPAANKSGGLGLLLMQQRAKAFGGTVAFKRLNPGFAVVVDIPASIGVPAA